MIRQVMLETILVWVEKSEIKYALQVELHDNPCEQGLLEDHQLSASW